VRSSYDDATFRLNGDIPATDVRANGMLSSVFRNLLNNAVDNPAVYVTATVDDGTARVTIVDNGPGILDNQKPDIFGKGKQGAEGTGTGIGLYLIHTLITQHGGRVTVADSDIGGARLSLNCRPCNRVAKGFYNRERVSETTRRFSGPVRPEVTTPQFGDHTNTMTGVPVYPDRVASRERHCRQSATRYVFEL
jgi:hypothetical protein